MDKLIEYAKLIKRILTEYIELCDRSSQPDIETFLITDEQKGHYIWMNLGWSKGDRITDITVYVRIRDRKFWIQEDWTEDGIATDFVRAGGSQGRYRVGISRAGNAAIHTFCSRFVAVI